MVDENNLPQLDIPKEFLVGDFITSEILQFYGIYPCKIKSAVFVLLLEGCVNVTINHSEYNLEPGDFITVLPETFIHVHKIEGQIKLYFAGFSYDTVSRILPGQSAFEYLPTVKEHSVFSLAPEPLEFYTEFFKTLILAQNNASIMFSKEVVKSILIIFLETISKQYRIRYTEKATEVNRAQDVYVEFIKLIDQNYQKHHNVAYYADKIGITVAHFCRTIKKASGKKPSDIINKILLMDAMAHLRSTSLTVKQVAAMLGFSNTVQFFRFFKRHTGLTPQQYRENDLRGKKHPPLLDDL